MLRRLQKLLTFFSVILVSLTLSACGHQHAQHINGRVKITFWHGMVGAHQTALNQLVREFNQSQSRYQVVSLAQGDSNNVQQKIIIGARSHTLPTIAQTPYTNVPDYVQTGFLASFSPYIKATDLHDIDPAFRQSINYHGKAYAMPFSKSDQVLFYNADILKKLHLKLPNTWTDLQHDSQIAQHHGYTGTVFDQTFTDQVNSLNHAAGTPLITTHVAQNFNVAKLTQNTQVLWHMFKTGAAITAGSDGYADVTFLKGDTLFGVGASAALAFMHDSAPKNMHWNTAPLPSYHGKHATSIIGNDIVLFKSASKPQRQGAAAFVKYLMSTKATTQWAKASGYLPLTKSAQKNAAYRRYLATHPYDQAPLQSLNFGFQDTAFEGYNQYVTTVGTTLSKMATDQQPPAKVFPVLRKQLLKLK